MIIFNSNKCKIMKKQVTKILPQKRRLNVNLIREQNVPVHGGVSHQRRI